MMVKKGKKPCNLCGLAPAEIPDRDRVPPRQTPEICRDCHAKRLRGDLVQVLTRYAPDPPEDR